MVISLDETYLADTRTCPGDEDGLSKQTRGVEYRHEGEAEETDGRMPGDGCPRLGRRRNRRVISRSHTMTGQRSETLLQCRWKNLLTWLEGHGFRVQNLFVDCREMSFG